MKLDTNSMRDYDIACALRGPDLPNTGNLKWALTCRIRYLADCASVPSRCWRLTVLEAEEAMAEAKEHKGKLVHYLDHIIDAARHLDASKLADLAYRLLHERRITCKQFVDLAGGD